MTWRMWSGLRSRRRSAGPRRAVRRAAVERVERARPRRSPQVQARRAREVGMLAARSRGWVTPRSCEQPRVVRDHPVTPERLEPADPRGVVDRPHVELAARPPTA